MGASLTRLDACIHDPGVSFPPTTADNVDPDVFTHVRHDHRTGCPCAREARGILGDALDKTHEPGRDEPDRSRRERQFTHDPHGRAGTQA